MVTNMSHTDKILMLNELFWQNFFYLTFCASEDHFTETPVIRRELFMVNTNENKSGVQIDVKISIPPISVTYVLESILISKYRDFSHLG